MMSNALPPLDRRRTTASWQPFYCLERALSPAFRNFHQSTTLLLSSSSTSSSQQQQTLVPGAEYESELEVKKSRFIGYAKHVSSWDEASEYIANIKKLHPKGRHWCFGFRTGSSSFSNTEDDAVPTSEPLNERCSDDGEPTGTAGAPILGAIQGEDLTNVVCVVVRYFGGIKLGAGGLIRAYGGAARQVLREAAPYQIVIPKMTFSVTVPANFIGAVYDMLGQIPGATSAGDESYGVDGSLTVSITCVSDEVETFRNGLQDATRGQVSYH